MDRWSNHDTASDRALARACTRSAGMGISTPLRTKRRETQVICCGFCARTRRVETLRHLRLAGRSVHVDLDAGMRETLDEQCRDRGGAGIVARRGAKPGNPHPPPPIDYCLGAWPARDAVGWADSDVDVPGVCTVAASLDDARLRRRERWLSTCA